MENGEIYFFFLVSSTGIRFAINLDKDSNDEVEFEIEQTIIHPFYNIPLGLNNIAILRLKRTVLQTGNLLIFLLKKVLCRS